MDDEDYSQEIWKPIPLADGYSVSNMGRFRADVRTSQNWLAGVRKATLDKNGYSYIRFLSGGKKRKEWLQRAVLLAFVGPPPSPKHQAAHVDGNPRNNRLDNLRWVTAKENNAHKRLHGTYVLGTETKTAKLDDEKVSFIRQSDLSGPELAKMFGVTRRTIDRARNGTGWPHVITPAVQRKRGIYHHPPK